MINLLEVAQIVKPQGIKGEVKLMPLTNVLAVFHSLKSAYIDGKEMKINHISVRENMVYIKFDEINDRLTAETYRNKMVCLPKELLEETKNDDDVLVDDLIGMVLYDDKGEVVGQILDIANYGASDILVVEKDKRTYEIPYVKEVFYEDNGVIKVKSEKLKEVLI